MQTHSRRGFISTCAAALAALGFGPARAFGSEALGMSDFAAMVTRRFYLVNGSATAYGYVKLMEVEEVSTDSGVSQFNLHLRGGRFVNLPEDLYTATNGSGYPGFDVHMQNAGVDGIGRHLYIASFAQLL